MKDKGERPQREQAVALHYQDAGELPKVLAAGVGELAREIIRLAEQHQIPVHEDTKLTELLSQIGVGATISPESYRLVAEVICFLYSADGEWAEKHKFLEFAGGGK